jgi:hypothetical protein
MAVNAWRLRQKVTGKKTSYLPFLRELTTALLTTHGTSQGTRKVAAIPPSISGAVR